MTLDEYCEIYVKIEWRNDISLEDAQKNYQDFKATYAPELSQRFEVVQPDDIEWFKQALEDDMKKGFAAFVFFDMEIPLPEELYETMLRAAVYEIDPSYNRYFVDPCREAFGLRRVNSSLLEVVKNGDNFEKAGAVNALYHASPPELAFKGIPPAYTKEYALPESVQAYDEYKDVRMEMDCLFLKEFINNSNVEVRQSLIPHLKLNDPSYYPEDIRPLVDEAIRIAQNHEDEYIRHRLEIKFDKQPPRTKPPYKAVKTLPYRKRKDSDQ
jgi:hypothetical protein